MISVVIPCYNHAGYLGECLESVRAQRHPGWEAIVVDDGSEDPVGVQQVIESLRDPRIRLHRLESNRGVATARNAGARAGSGDILVFLDADDRLAPTYLEVLAGALLSDSSLDCAFCDSLYFGVEPRLRHCHVPTRKEILDGLTLQGAGLMIQRRKFEDLGGYDEGFCGREDWEFYIRLFHSDARAQHVPEPLYHYRVTGTGLNVRAWSRDHVEMQSLYAKHKRLFDAAGAGRAVLSRGCNNSARAAYHRGEWAHALRFLARGMILHPRGTLDQVLRPLLRGAWRRLRGRSGKAG